MAALKWKFRTGECWKQLCKVCFLRENIFPHKRLKIKTMADEGNKKFKATTEENNYTTHCYIYF